MNMEDRYTEWDGEHGCGRPGKDCYTRLAEYEDTGLEPSEIDSEFIHSVIKENHRLKNELNRHRPTMADCTEIHMMLDNITEEQREELARMLANQRVTVVESIPHPVERLRPCLGTYWNRGEQHRVKGRFHGWGAGYQEFEAGPGNFTTALVEGDDGQIFECDPGTIQFIDRENGERR